MRIAPRALDHYNSAAAADAARMEADTRRLQARLKTREVGFNVGRLGVSFSSRDIEFEPGEAGKSSESFRSKSYRHTQSEELHVGQIRREMDRSAVSLDGKISFESSSVPQYLRNRAASAYRALSSGPEHVPGRALGSV